MATFIIQDNEDTTLSALLKELWRDDSVLSKQGDSKRMSDNERCRTGKQELLNASKHLNIKTNPDLTWLI